MSGSDRFLVTGACGCLGAWTVQRLVAAGVPVWGFDRTSDRHRLKLIMSDAELSRVHFIEGDIADADGFAAAVAANGITHIVHLAALQIPFVRADPVQGALVNVVGTTVVFDAARRHPDLIRGLAYASSVGVYGSPEMYPSETLTHDAPLHPPTLYGVYKQANEGIARIYWEENGIPSVGLRPYVVYGPGRDQGSTSTPTRAMLAAVVGRPYRISYGGTAVYHYAADAAEAFIKAAGTSPEGAPIYNLGGSTASMADIVGAIEAAAPDAAGTIGFEPAPLPHPPMVDDQPLHAVLGPVPWTPLNDGVRQTIERFHAAVAAGSIDVDAMLG